MLHRPPELAGIFDEIPDDYEARTDYPDGLWGVLVEQCGLGPGCRVLEIGPGSGQATIPMLERGAHVTAVEPGAGLARRLRERTAGFALHVIVSRFETVDISEAEYDLVASATAFHWVEPSVGLAKCARALRDGGSLALWWTIWGDPERADPFHDALRPILEVKAPQLLEVELTPQIYAQDLEARTGQIEAVGAFGPIHRHVFRWHGEHDPVAIRRLFATFAPWLALPAPLRAELLNDIEQLAAGPFGGLVRRPYQTVLYVAGRLPRP